jgi:acyl dehydratase
MSVNELAQRTFTLHDLQWFAAASGDWNPIHVDPVQARRLLAGEVMVHGMFTLLWALQEHCAAAGGGVAGIVANFSKPVLVGRRLRLISELSADTGTARLSIRDDDIEVVTVLLTLGGSVVHALPHAEQPPQQQPEAKHFADLKGAAGTLSVTALLGDIRQAFPRAAQELGVMPVAALMALSRLVGMQCPGLHSLFAGIDVRLDPSRTESQLTWQVCRMSVPQAPLRVSLEGSGIVGWLDAFVRPAPVAQAGMGEVALAMADGASLAGQTALIVGGSRGLGELTAKIVASGGGHAIVTYLHGAADAERVVAEIIHHGGRASALPMDVAHPGGALAQLARDGIVPTHLYYFAAPRIGGRKGGGFDVLRWQAFCKVFVEAFAGVVHSVKRAAPTLQVFYPSTVFINELPAEYAEYVAAKAAGEAVCRHLAQHIPGLGMLVRRLPRLPTDQTAGLIRLANAEPLPLMLNIVREMQSLSFLSRFPTSSSHETQP